MTRSTTSLALALAIALSASAANAGDWNNGAGGMKDSGGLAGVPVPAPVPVMESFNWYVRADLGYAVKSTGSSTTTTSLGASLTQDYDGNDGPFHGTVGIGRYLTPSLRMDVTGDYRGLQHAQNGTTHYTATTLTAGPQVPVGAASVETTQINTFAVTRAEEVRLANHAFLLNGYWDFNRGGALNPYIGAGAGISVREGRVEYSEIGVCTQTVNSLGVPPGPQPCPQPNIVNGGKPSSVHFGLAAALMAGVTYEVAQGVLLDTGYRLAWQGGNTTIKMNGGDLISAGTRTDHEFRAGLRWNIW